MSAPNVTKMSRLFLERPTLHAYFSCPQSVMKTFKSKGSEWVTALGSSPSFISRDHITIRGSALTPGVSVEQSRDLPVKWQLITSTPAAVRISPSCLPSTVFKVRTWTFYSSVCAAGCSGGFRLDCWVIKKKTTGISHGLRTVLYASITKIN